MTDTIMPPANRFFAFSLVVALACAEALLACGGGSPSDGVARGSGDAATDIDVGTGSVITVPSRDASSSDAATTPDSSSAAPTPDSGTPAIVDAGTEGAIEDSGSDSQPVDAEVDAPAETAPVCTSAQLLCAGTCVPIDANDCGACGTSCAGETPVCSFAGGAFSCVSGCSGTEILCAGVCTDTSTSTSNCGGCGSAYACPGEDQCVNRSCLFIVSGHALDLTSTASQPPPLADRQVALLDANGVRTQVTTDANGAFSVSGVTPPYDALVFVAPGSGPPVNLAGGPAAYLGLTTAHPRLLGAPAAGTSLLRSVTLNVPLALTACGATNCRYAVGTSVEGSPQLNGGAFGGFYDAADLSQTASGSTGWAGSTSAVLDVYVLACDEAGTHYWYGTAAGVAVTDQGTVTSPLITPAAVPILDTTSMTADMSLLPGWGAPTLFVEIELSGGWFTMLQENASTTLSAAVPNIPGASLYLAVNSGFQGSGAEAFATVPLTTTSETISVPAPPVLTSPLAGASLSAATGQITWSGASPTEVQRVYFLYEPDGGETVEGMAWTSGSSVNLARLTTLGMALTGGPTTIALVGEGRVASLNAMVDEQTLASPDDTEGNGVDQSFTLTP